MTGFPDVLGWSIADHLDARRRGLSAVDATRAVLAFLHGLDDPAVLIGGPLDDVALAAAAEVDRFAVDDRPLHGVPFVVKDNIDVAGAVTTCACPGYSRLAAADSAVVAALRAAGAIPVGKTNMDQFATGLVGTRSPYGTPRNPVNADLVPGGSSSGSAVAVARGLVPFALGTDTAGSGRVPAAMCRIVGLKPTVGRLPSAGIVPAVRRIDCATVFARSVADARLAADIAAVWMPSDPYSKTPRESIRAIRRIGVLDIEAPVRSTMDTDALRAYEDAVERARSLGYAIVPVDVEPFLATGALLYAGPFVAERTAAVGDFLATLSEGVDPTVGAIIRGGATRTAVDAYRGEYHLAEIRAATRALWDGIDALLLPTTPGVATLAAVAAEPVSVNSWLGTFTTFANLLDLSAVAVPVGSRADGLPCGVQVIGPAWSDDAVADVAAALMGEAIIAVSPRAGETLLAVVGAHLSGMVLNAQLASRSARLVSVTSTAPSYRLHALAGTVPPKPGLRRVSEDGTSIAVEVWALGASAFASFVAEVPPPLAIGSLQLADGTWVKGFVCEPEGFNRSTDITAFGGWRAYIASLAPAPPAPLENRS